MNTLKFTFCIEKYLKQYHSSDSMLKNMEFCFKNSHGGHEKVWKTIFYT